MDVTLLASAITAAVRKAFIELVTRAGEEQVYAFALYSDEDAVTLCPAANTLEYLEAEAEEEDRAYYKFEPAEWKFEMEGANDDFNEISRLLYEAAQNETDRISRAIQLRTTSVAVLARLKEEGFFRATAGQDVLLLYAVSDADMVREEIETVITRLNGEPYRQQYLDWMKSWNE